MSSTKVRSGTQSPTAKAFSLLTSSKIEIDAPHPGKPWLNQKSDRKSPIRRELRLAEFSHGRVGFDSLQKEAIQFQASWHDFLQNAGANAEWLHQSRCRRAPARTAGLIPHSSRRAASRFTCVDFPQPSEPSNVINGMATILRQRAAIVEHPIFALFGWRQRGKFDLMTEAVAADFLPVLAAETPRRSFVVSVHDVAPCTREASARIIEALKQRGCSYHFAFGCAELSPPRKRNRGQEFCFLVARSRGARL